MASYIIPSLLFLLSLSTAHPPESYSSPSSSLPSSSCCNKRNIGYNPIQVADQAIRLSTHSWEYGTLAEALLDLYTPALSVFSPQAFPNRHLPKPDPSNVPSLHYIKPHIRLNSPTLIEGDGATGDPASLGVSALLIGQTLPAYNRSATRQFNFLKDPAKTPRLPNGAMSHREAYPSAWADFIALAPPFLAYYAVGTQNDTYIRLALMQCLLYREILKPNGTDSNAWQHIIGGPTKDEDFGRWSTGIGWAAMGMARVLATLVHWFDLESSDQNPRIAAGDLFRWIGKILVAAMETGTGKNGLLKNYWDQEEWDGEISGTALITATLYRVAVLQDEAAAVFDEPGSNYARPVSPLFHVHPLPPPLGRHKSPHRRFTRQQAGYWKSGCEPVRLEE